MEGKDDLAGLDTVWALPPGKRAPVLVPTPVLAILADKILGCCNQFRWHRLRDYLERTDNTEVFDPLPGSSPPETPQSRAIRASWDAICAECGRLTGPLLKLAEGDLSGIDMSDPVLFGTEREIDPHMLVTAATLLTFALARLGQEWDLDAGLIPSGALTPFGIHPKLLPSELLWSVGCWLYQLAEVPCPSPEALAVSTELPAVPAPVVTLEESS